MNKSSKLHFLFLFILSLNYLIPLIIFGKITLFYADALESEIVYNNFIGEFAKGNFNSIDILTGFITWEQVRRVFNPIFYLYAFNFEFSYWLIDIILKISAYISFFILAKKINKNYLLNAMLACLFASTTDQVQFGFGLAISPYLIYLIISKDQIKFKHYLIIVLFGLNSDLMTTVWLMPLICFASYFINNKIIENKKINAIKILSTFNIFLFLTSAHLILFSFFGETTHRDEFIRSSLPLFENLTFAIKQLFRIPYTFDHLFFQNIQFAVFLIPAILITLIIKDKISLQFLFLIIFVILILFFLRTETFIKFQNSSQGLIKTTNFTYINVGLPLIYVIYLLYLCKVKKILKLMLVPISISLFIFQIDASIVPFTKAYILKDNSEYKNLYTFSGYYSYDDYSEIKKIVKNKRTMSVGLNPMIAAINEIKVIDGYYNIYPLSHKKRYRKIIDEEIENNYFLKNNYDAWGSRLMIYYKPDENYLNNKIKFKEAKKIGVAFVISKYMLQNKDLELIKKVNRSLYLFKIL